MAFQFLRGGPSAEAGQFLRRSGWEMHVSVVGRGGVMHVGPCSVWLRGWVRGMVRGYVARGGSESCECPWKCMGGGGRGGASGCRTWWLVVSVGARGQWSRVGRG